MKKRSYFWKIYIGLVIFAVAAFSAVLILLWNFLAAYEKSQSDTYVSQIVDKLNNDDYSSIETYLKIQTSEFDSEAEVLSATKAQYTGSSWTYSKYSNEYSKDRPVYQLKYNDKRVGLIYLNKSEETGAFNTPVWKVGEVTGIVMDSITYTIDVPTGSKVYVNGRELSDSYQVGEPFVSDNLGNVVNYIEAPTMTRYEINNIYSSVSCRAIGPVMGNELAVDEQNDNSIIFSYEYDADLAASVEDRIITISENYANYVTDDVGFSAVSPYIVKSSYAYSYLQYVAQTNIWFASHDSAVFEDMRVYNYQMYTDDCFSCEVSFNQIINVYGVGEKNFNTHIKYVFIKQNDNWYVADISLKS